MKLVDCDTMRGVRVRVLVNGISQLRSQRLVEWLWRSPCCHESDSNSRQGRQSRPSKGRKDACDEMELCKTRMVCSQAFTVVVLELVSRASVERTL
jgi:hypothetical protein